jgi:hypothetical protein
MNTACLILLYILFLYPYTASFAQKTNNLGYVITNANDTIYGKITDRREGAFEKLHNPIRLKGKGLFSKKFSPYKIKAYKKGDEYYESLWYKSEKKLFEENLTSIPKVGKKVFMKVVSQGYLTLYYLEFIDGDSGYIDYIPLFKRKDESYFVRTTQGILGLKKKNLSIYFKDCPELVRLINDGSIKSSIEVAKFYNEWTKKKSALD